MTQTIDARISRGIAFGIQSLSGTLHSPMGAQLRFIAGPAYSQRRLEDVIQAQVSRWRFNEDDYFDSPALGEWDFDEVFDAFAEAVRRAVEHACLTAPEVIAEPVKLKLISSRLSRHVEWQPPMGPNPFEQCEVCGGPLTEDDHGLVCCGCVAGGRTDQPDAIWPRHAA